MNSLKFASVCAVCMHMHAGVYTQPCGVLMHNVYMCKWEVGTILLRIHRQEKWERDTRPLAPPQSLWIVRINLVGYDSCLEK